jgi:predicted DCC family thiol-disulfide oxidoreductase YuxK
LNTQGNTRHDSFRTRGFDPAIYPLTLYYESACPLCNAEMNNLRLRDSHGLLNLVDISAPGFADFPEGADMNDLLTLIHARTADGRVLKGVDAFRLAYEAVGLDWISGALRLPLLGRLADLAYPVLARNRHRLPRRLIVALFERGWRRAAERAAAARCDSSTCTR